MYRPPTKDDTKLSEQVKSDSESDSQGDEPEPSFKEKNTEVAYSFYDCNDEVIEIFNCRIFSFDEIELYKLIKCKEFILRKNLIHKLKPLPDHLANRLTVLDLFDNKIKRISDFFESHMVLDTSTPSMDSDAVTEEKEKAGQEGSMNNDSTSTRPPMIKKHVAVAFPNLVKLDLSYNQIRKISGLDSLAGTLKELYLVENKIKTITGLDALVNLELLELGGNNISSIGHSLDKLSSLKELWIGKNKISSLDDSLHHLHKLEKLSLQANRLTKIEPHNFPEGNHPNLHEAFFSENGIEVIENIYFHAIQLLDFSTNPISTINEAVINKENMPDLNEFWLTDGTIKDWKEVEKFKPFEATLRTLYLERNPIEDHIRYRDLVYQHLPFLTQIDSWPIVNKDNVEADRVIERRRQM